ncbi:GL10766 [Drosophila persimilis]|uniref:Transcription factor grauzone n=2 Tax=pseudoobscura subgroup TaxID=32358 RepID=A0A6I8USY7_DROPS|nr:transcription factor grauzone [Drosophila pseudoobscura]XP_002015915.1 transcription factor grauzone [Drosophila persimilis]EDW31805.1 GL10766 [Drosophila persimilis]
MICRLCLNSVSDTDTIQIFESIGVTLNVATVLGKYFWFEPKNDDPISTVLCVGCWNQVSQFHEFFVAVEKAHRLLTERFSLNVGEKSNSVQPEIEEEPNQLPDEAEEAPQLPDGKEELSHLLDEPEKPLPLSDGAEELLFQQELDVGHQDCDSDASFSNEQFLSQVLCPQDTDDQQAMEKQEEVDFKNVPLIAVEERRETRSTARIKSHQAANMELLGADLESLAADAESLEVTDSESKPVNTSATVAKRRMRSRKSEQHSMKAKRYVDYKKSMLDIDQKIAGHMRLTCDICHQGHATFLLLCKHMLQVHHRKGYAICCHKKFYKRSALTDHIDRHTDPEKFKCTECDKTFADKQCLRNHELLKHQPDDVKVFMCEQCPKRYTKQYLLEQHRIIHKERTIPCGICDRRFPNNSLLSTHVKMVHSNYGTMCDICAQVIRGRAAFKRHQLEHSGVSEPKVQCDICGSWHKNRHSLKKHVRRHKGSSEEVRTCKVCGKVSPNRSAMLSHQRYVHLADRKHECSVCNKAFKKAITLKEHMAMHTGEVLYKCPHCPKTFNSNANKHTHRKKAHPKEFEEARKARTESRMATAVDGPGPDPETQIITISTEGDEGESETQNILLTATEEELKAEGIEFTLCLSPQAAE